MNAEYGRRKKTDEWERNVEALNAAAALSLHDEECDCVATFHKGHHQAADAVAAAIESGQFTSLRNPITMTRDGVIVTVFRRIM